MSELLHGCGRIMSSETYCRENVYSSISSVERFSVEGCISCLPACRGSALLPLTLGPQLFVFLIGFFCEEQKSGRTHADVICNQSRKQASEFILGDAHGDSDSVCVALWSLSYISTALQLTADKNDGEIAYGTPSFQSGSCGKRACGDSGVKYVILEHLALFFSTQVVYCHRHKHSQMQLGSGVLNISPRYLGADIIC